MGNPPVFVVCANSIIHKGFLFLFSFPEFHSFRKVHKILYTLKKALILDDDKYLKAVYFEYNELTILSMIIFSERFSFPSLPRWSNADTMLKFYVNNLEDFYTKNILLEEKKII